MIFIFTIYQSHRNSKKHSNELHTEIIKGTTENPLFRASDIGNILEMSNIHASLKEFDDTEKVINSIYTPGGNQHVTI